MNNQIFSGKYSGTRWLLATAISIGLLAAAITFRASLTPASAATAEEANSTYRTTKVLVAEDQMAGGGNLNKPSPLYKPHETDFSARGFWIASNERGLENGGSETISGEAGITIYETGTNNMLARLNIENMCIPVVNPNGSRFGCAPKGAEDHPRHPHGIDIDETRGLAYQVIEHSGLMWNAFRSGFKIARTTDQESGMLVVYDISDPRSPRILAGYILGHAAEEVAINETNGKAYVGNHEPLGSYDPCFVSIIDRSAGKAAYKFIDLPDENQCVQGIEVNERLGQVFGTTHIGQVMYAFNSKDDSIAYSVDIRAPFEAFVAALPADQQFTIPMGQVLHMHDLTTDQVGLKTYQSIHTIASPFEIEEDDQELVNTDTADEFSGRWVAAVDVDPVSKTFKAVTIIDLSNGQSVPAVPYHENNPQADYAKRFVHAHFLALDPILGKLFVTGEHTGNMAIVDLASIGTTFAPSPSPAGSALKVLAISRPIPGCKLAPEELNEPHVHGVNVDSASGRVYVSDEGEDCLYESVTIVDPMTAAPVSGDFNGDGKTDVAVFRPKQGTWFFDLPAEAPESHGQFAVQWGLSTDTLVPADYDGDGAADVAVFRPSPKEGNANFYILFSHGHGPTFMAITLGSEGDIPIVRDYDGDGMADVAVYRPSDSAWFVRKSSTGDTETTFFGIPGDTPFTGDMDADGKADYGVYRTGVWQCKMSGGGYYDEEFGQKGDGARARRLRQRRTYGLCRNPRRRRLKGMDLPQQLRRFLSELPMGPDERQCSSWRL